MRKVFKKQMKNSANHRIVRYEVDLHKYEVPEKIHGTVQKSHSSICHFDVLVPLERTFNALSSNTK